MRAGQHMLTLVDRSIRQAERYIQQNLRDIELRERNERVVETIEGERREMYERQDKLAELRVEQDLKLALYGTDAVIFAVRHKHYLDLDPDKVVETAGAPMAVIDCFGILDDVKIKRYFELGCEVKGLGRGHVQRIKDQVRTEREEMLMTLNAKRQADSS